VHTRMIQFQNINHPRQLLLNFSQGSRVADLIDARPRIRRYREEPGIVASQSLSFCACPFSFRNGEKRIVSSTNACQIRFPNTSFNNEVVWAAGSFRIFFSS
jgi:hypothetical protein